MNLANAFAFSRQRHLALMAIAATATLAGCSTIPSSGPTGGQMVAQIENNLGALPIKPVEVRSVADLPGTTGPAALFGEEYMPPAPTELVGSGDVLNITIYETCIGLFGRGGGAAVAGADQGFGPSSRAERFLAMRADDDGTINMPFVGETKVAGRTRNEIERLLRNALRRKSQNPQSLVSITEGLTSSIIIGGIVRQPGRLVLPTNRESHKDRSKTPTIRHFNMMQASSYLLAQRFTLRDKDVLYIGNAEANQPTKLVQIVSQLFFPLVTLEGVINRPN